MTELLEFILIGITIGLSVFFGTVMWKVTGDEFDSLKNKLWARILLTALASLAIPILMLTL